MLTAPWALWALVRISLRKRCPECLLLDNMLPPPDQNMNYYQEYCRLFIANVVLTSQMKELIAEKNELLARVNDLEVLFY